MRNILTCAFLTVCLAAGVLAQQPAGLSETSIALYQKKIAVRYSAPASKGQKVLGGLVTPKKAWPIGGNSPAILQTEGNLVFKGVVVPKGEYSLYLLVEADKWQLVINKQTGPKAAYDPKMDLGRVPMVLRESAAGAESFKVALSKSGARAARLDVALDNTVGSAPFSLDWVPGEPEW
jgi:hypothetical protein